ncbi:hypothetical protein DFQ27_009283, partial [Actinomortierella ambigua]
MDLMVSILKFLVKVTSIWKASTNSTIWKVVMATPPASTASSFSQKYPTLSRKIANATASTSVDKG